MNTPRGINPYAAGLALIEGTPARILPDYSYMEPDLKQSLTRAGITAELEVDSGCFWIHNPNGREETLLIAYIESDQSKDYVIATRYLPSADGEIWDWWKETRLYYPSFDALAADIAAENYEEGVRASFFGE